MTNPIEITQDLELALTTQEREDLEHCEAVIRHGRQVFVEVGEALSMIRDARLYRADYASFEAYCEERWDLSRPRAYELIAAAPVVRRLSAIADTPAPANEAQVRPLTRLEDEAEQDEVWKAAAERRGDGQPPTARQVEEEIEHRRALSEEGADDAARELLATAGPNKGKPPAQPPAYKGPVPTSKSNERYTPERYIEAARRVLGEIDLDPASCEEADRTVRALTYYTEQDDGLSQRWVGRVWLNPPYGTDETGASNAGRWVAKLIDEYNAGNVTAGIGCLNSLTYAPWFQQLWPFVICFTDHRIHFRPGKAEGQADESGDELDPTKADKKRPMNGTAFFYVGPSPDDFVDVFSEFGAVVKAIALPRKPQEVPDGTD